jgi:hypothetical protein
MTAARAHAQPCIETYTDHLDPLQLADLFRDIEMGGELREIRLEGAVDKYSQLGALGLERCRVALVLGELSGLHLVYDRSGRTWSDSLQRTPTGFDWVRVELPDI